MSIAWGSDFIWYIFILLGSLLVMPILKIDVELLGQHLSEVPDKNSDHEKRGNIPGEHRRSSHRGAQWSLEAHGTLISRGPGTPLNVEAKHVSHSLPAHSQLRDCPSPRGHWYTTGWSLGEDGKGHSLHCRQAVKTHFSFKNTNFPQIAEAALTLLLSRQWSLLFPRVPGTQGTRYRSSDIISDERPSSTWSTKRLSCDLQPQLVGPKPPEADWIAQISDGSSVLSLPWPPFQLLICGPSSTFVIVMLLFSFGVFYLDIWWLILVLPTVPSLTLRLALTFISGHYRLTGFCPPRYWLITVRSLLYYCQGQAEVSNIIWHTRIC